MARKKTKKPSMKRKKIQIARSQKELGFLNLLTINKNNPSRQKVTHM